MLDLEVDRENCENDDSNKIAVEGLVVRVPVDCALSDLVMELDLVGEATSVDRDASDQAVAANEGSDEDDHLLLDEKGYDEENNGHTDYDSIVSSRWANCKGGWQKDSDQSSTECCEGGDGPSSELDEDESYQVCCNKDHTHDSPLDPLSLDFLKEQSEEEVTDNEEQCGSSYDIDDCIDKLVSKEGKEEAEDHKDYAPDPVVLRHERQELGHAEGWATVLTLVVDVDIAAIDGVLTLLSEALIDIAHDLNVDLVVFGSIGLTLTVSTDVTELDSIRISTLIKNFLRHNVILILLRIFHGITFVLDIEVGKWVADVGAFRAGWDVFFAKVEVHFVTLIRCKHDLLGALFVSVDSSGQVEDGRFCLVDALLDVLEVISLQEALELSKNVRVWSSQILEVW